MAAAQQHHRHTPVMLDRCVDLLAPALQQPGAVAIDGTLGMGGHTEALLTRCPQATVVGIDRDPQAIALASERLAAFGDRFRAHHAEYDDIAGALAVARADAAAGILLDLGVSSLQIDEAERGFSYAQDAPLDMRMNSEDPITAADILRDADVAELTRILRDYGEERYAARIAESIVRRRETAPITRSAELVDLVRACIPAATRTPGSNPAKRTFQGLRIAVNRELEVLERVEQLGDLFAETASSGAPVIATPGQNGVGLTRQGFLERSNVDVVTELINLILAQRAFEFNSRAVRTSDNMLAATAELIR